jgi:ubiquinone/menaquinone biosynthesis C-methylase UbiE
MPASRDYVLGHTEAELKRLTTQARLIDPVTRRFLVSAGIVPGMRVLDVGSGAGDVAILLAAVVGPKGEVIGSDSARAAIEMAEHRIRAGEIPNICFLHGDPAEMTFEKPFDAVVGRYVLQFMSNPSAALSKLARHVRPGGIIMFHELDWDGARSSPRVPTYDRTCAWISRTIDSSLAQSRLGPQLALLYEQAGLPPATMQLEALIASGRAAMDMVHLVTDLVETLLPAMAKAGIATASEVDLPTLASRILAEVGTDAALIGRAEVAAWTRV